MVTDPTGMPMRGIRITACSATSEVRWVQSSDEEGLYEFASLPPGAYALIATAPGMRSYLVNRVNVLPGAVAEINVVMLVDTATEDRSGRAVR
jgi:hypothetical protein